VELIYKPDEQNRESYPNDIRIGQQSGNSFVSMQRTFQFSNADCKVEVFCHLVFLAFSRVGITDFIANKFLGFFNYQSLLKSSSDFFSLKIF